MSLEIRRKIHVYQEFRELAMHDHLINRVHELEDHVEGANDLYEGGCPIFELEIGEPIDGVDQVPPENNTCHQGDADNKDERSDKDDDDNTENNDNNGGEGNDGMLPIEYENDIKEEPELFAVIDNDESLSDTHDQENLQQEARSKVDLDLESEQESRSKTDRNGDSSNKNNNLQKARSKIVESNIIEGKRPRTAAPILNIKSFKGKKYDNMTTPWSKEG